MRTSQDLADDVSTVSNSTTQDISASTGEKGNSLSHAVLLHTLPPGPEGVRSEEAAFRQYFSCIDFSFREDLGRGNARRLKRLNAIFERAADRRSGGIREDKLLRLLPSGTAVKFGLDPDAIKRRQQERREQQQKEMEEEESSGKKRSKRKKKKRSKKKNGEAAPQPAARVVSRGTFLAMFAYESCVFINALGQNERLDRERKATKQDQRRHSLDSPPKLESVSQSLPQPQLPRVPSPPSASGRKSLKSLEPNKKKRRSKRKSKRRQDKEKDLLQNKEEHDKTYKQRGRSRSSSRTRSSDKDLSPPKLKKASNTNASDPFHQSTTDQQASTSLQKALLKTQPQPPHSADEAGGYPKHPTPKPKPTSSLQDRQQLRRLKKQKSKSRRLEVERELQYVEHRKRMLEEEHARILRENGHVDLSDKEPTEECIFLNSVTHVLRELLPGLGSSRAVVGVAPPSDNNGYAPYGDKHSVPTQPFFHLPPSQPREYHAHQQSSLQNALQHLKSSNQTPMVSAPAPVFEESDSPGRDLRAMSYASFSSHSSQSTEDSVIGDSMIASPSR